MAGDGLSGGVGGLGQAVRRPVLAAWPDPDLVAAYVGRRDEAAFAELVRRHGPVVLAACRRRVRDAGAAEDAFQATFLVLAQRADRVARPDRLAGWLAGVARRAAGKARRRLARQAAVERPAVDPAAPPEHPDGDWRAVVHEELARLPADYRAAVVVCDLEGVARRAAAARLGIPDGTLSNRLARARAMLGRRLVRRGVSLGLAAVPARLEAAAVRAACGGPPSPSVLSLTSEALTPMLPVRTALLILLAGAGGLAALAGGSPRQDAHAPSPRADRLRQPDPEPDPDPETEAAPNRAVYDLAYSPDSKRFAVLVGQHFVDGPGSALGRWTVYDAATHKKLSRVTSLGDLPEHGRSIEFGPGGLLYVPEQGGTVWAYDAATAAVRKRFEAGPGDLVGCRLSPDGKLFVTDHRARPGRVWVAAMRSADSFAVVREVRSEAELSFGTFRPDGKAIAFSQTPATGDRAIVEIDPGSGAELRRFAVEPRMPGAKPVAWPASYSPDGGRLALAGGEGIPTSGGLALRGYVRVRDRATGTTKALGDGKRDYFRTAVWSPDGTRLFAGTLGAGAENHPGTRSPAGEVRCWDTTTWRELWVAEIAGGNPRQLAVTPSGRRLWVADTLGLWLLDADTGKVRGSLVRTPQD